MRKVKKIARHPHARSQAWLPELVWFSAYSWTAAAGAKCGCVRGNGMKPFLGRAADGWGSVYCYRKKITVSDRIYRLPSHRANTSSNWP